MKKKSKKGLKPGILKEKIRRLMLSRRDRLSCRERKEKSGKIWKLLSGMQVFKSAATVMFYSEIGSEVETEKMIKDAIKIGKNVVLPVSNKNSQSIAAYKVCSMKDDVRKGAYGIKEPIMSRCARIAPRQVDIVIVPGIAFDKSGSRIGYGKGYYDRWLKKFGRYRRVAVAYGMQIIKKLPVTRNDVKVGSIVTEQKIFETNATRS